MCVLVYLRVCLCVWQSKELCRYVALEDVKVDILYDDIDVAPTHTTKNLLLFSISKGFTV